MWKFVAYLFLLLAIAVGVAWYLVRPDFLRREPQAPSPTAAAPKGEDASWLADLYSQNPADAKKGAGKVTELGARALPQIQETLRNPSADRDHRRAALRACALLGLTAAPAVADVAGTLDDPDLTAEAAIALSFMGPDAFPPLEEALASDDAGVRRESLRSIGKLRFRAPINSDDVLPLLKEGMIDPDPSVRAVAATYLGIIHEQPAESVALLAQGLVDADPEVRRASATALGSFGSDAAPALPQLRKASGDQDPDLAREAGRALVAVTGAKQQQH